MEERIQVVDRDRNKLMVKERSAVHRDGDWHETFQCWFVEIVKRGAIYLFSKKEQN